MCGGLVSGEKEKLILRINMENLDKNSSPFTHLSDFWFPPLSHFSVYTATDYYFQRI